MRWLNRQRAHEVRTPQSSLPQVLVHLEEVEGMRAAFGARPEDRLIECLDVVIADGRLRHDLPHRAMRNRVAVWLTAAGVPCTVLNDLWEETLPAVFRRSIDPLARIQYLELRCMTLLCIGEEGAGRWPTVASQSAD